MEDESSKRYKKIIAGLVLVMAYFSMHAMGLTFGDLWGMVQGELDQTRAKTHEYRNSDFNEQVSREMREQAAKASGESTDTGAEGGLNNELAAERKRMMEQSANSSEQNRDKMLKGNTETLNKQVRRNVRDSGGDN